MIIGIHINILKAPQVRSISSSIVTSLFKVNVPCANPEKDVFYVHSKVVQNSFGWLKEVTKKVGF